MKNNQINERAFNMAYISHSTTDNSIQGSKRAMNSSYLLRRKTNCPVAFLTLATTTIFVLLYASSMLVNQKSACTYPLVSVNPKLAAMTDSKSKLLQQIHSSTELHQQYHLLTIAIDSEGSCPQKCAFIIKLNRYINYFSKFG